MPSTPNLAIPYLEGATPTNFWTVDQAAAERIEDLITADRTRLTTLESASSGTVAYASGVAASAADGVNVIQRGKLVILSARLAISAAKAQNVTLFTVNPAALRPVTSELPFTAFTSAGMAAGVVTSAGIVKLPFQALSNGQGVLFSCAWWR